MINTGFFVGGREVRSSGGWTVEKVNPATAEPFALVDIADTVDVDRAVASAHEGLARWSSFSGVERARVLFRTAEILRERNDEIAALEVRDVGKPISEASVVDVVSAADCLEHFAGLASKITGRTFELRDVHAYTRREPLGVCAGIGAWNYPVQIAAWKAAPALACGNAMVFKPSELSPHSALELARAFVEAGLPEGVFNVVQGDASTGQLLSQHAGVAKVSFTGGAPTGARVMADAASTLKRVTMELGGKSPLIIFDDADVARAVTAAHFANFYTQGEVCTNGTRVFVHRSIVDTFLSAMIAHTSKLKIGDPLDPETEVGALISSAHRDKVEGYIAAGREAGAELVYGGTRPDLAGYFLNPAIFAQCTDEMSIVREEIFGPVMSVLVFDDEDEVLTRANDTEFGLAAGIVTKDLSRAHRVSARLDAGTVWVNTYGDAPVELPFGGFKRSGLGVENGLSAIEHYTRLKTVYVDLS